MQKPRAKVVSMCVFIMFRPCKCARHVFISCVCAQGPGAFTTPFSAAERESRSVPNNSAQSLRAIQDDGLQLRKIAGRANGTFDHF